MFFPMRLLWRSRAWHLLQKLAVILMVVGSGSAIGVKSMGIARANVPEVLAPSRQIPLDLPDDDRDSGEGGLIAADVNGDGQKDILMSMHGLVAAYALSGEKLWSKQISVQLSDKSEKKGLPGLHAAGLQATDVDGDSTVEVLLLDKDGILQILNGVDGTMKHRIVLNSPLGTEHWEHLVVANFRGKGDRDLLLQTTNREGYRLGRHLAAYSLKDLLEEATPQPLWQRDDFFSTAHSGTRVADLDGDGKDEVLGGTLLSSEGEILVQLPVLPNRHHPHLDSVFVADVRPDIPGLEVVALEEGGVYLTWAEVEGIPLLLLKAVNFLTGGRIRKENRVFLYNRSGLIWETHYKYQEPQNAAIGDFDLNQPGLEIWCRSRHDTGQKPFVFSARGELLTTYELERVAPAGWTEKGVEVIFTVDWTGDRLQLAAAKERHTAGDVALFDPIRGEFLYRLPERADRLYVADVVGDWREELLVLNGDRLHLYQNTQPNPQPDLPSLWQQNAYRRSKITWNYYNP